MSARSKIVGLGRRAHSVSRAAGESSAARKMGMGLLGATAVGAGVISGANSAMDAAFDVAFDDPQADRAFVGGDIGFGTLIGSQIPGLKGLSKAHLYGDANQIAGGYMGAAASVGGMGLGAATIGGGYGLHKALAKRTVPPNAIPRGGKALMGVGAGMMVAGLVGTFAGIGQTKRGYQGMSEKQNAFVNTTNNDTMGTMSRLNISGDIVLGAHNTRRGY